MCFLLKKLSTFSEKICRDSCKIELSCLTLRYINKVSKPGLEKNIERIAASKLIGKLFKLL